jgi:myo-inositol-1-phosphate synthase
MKSPPLQFTDDEARELVEAFIRGDEPVKARRRAGAAGVRQPVLQKNS